MICLPNIRKQTYRQNVGAKVILLESGYGTARLEEKVEPDYICLDLRDIVEML